MLYLHDRKTGLIFPFPIHLIWKYKVHILIYCAVFNAFAPFIWMAIPKPAYVVEAESAEALRIENCEKTGKTAEQIYLCKNFGTPTSERKK